MSGKMIGRRLHYRRCSCCCGPIRKRTVKRTEERQWRRELDVG